MNSSVPTETLLVLNGGTLISGDAVVPNRDTQGRITYAFGLARSNKNIGTIAMIGGDAEVMHAWAQREECLTDGKIAILSDTRSHDTVGNAHFSKVFVGERRLWDFSVVTADYHAARTAWTFKRVFGREVIVHGAQTSYGPEDLDRLKRREQLLTVAAHILLAGIEPEDDARREKRLLRWWPTYKESIFQTFGAPLRQILSPRQ